MFNKPIHKIISKYSREKNYAFSTSKVLDIGCGSGDSVKELLDSNIDAYGADIVFKSGEYVDFLSKNDRIKLMEFDNNLTYRIPFDDNYFDIVYADQVIEHVQDIKGFKNEICRVLKPKGFFVGYFPSKYKFVEPHVGIPFGGFFSSEWYVSFCVFVGAYFRYKYEPSESINITAKKIKTYLDTKTCYRKKIEILQVFKDDFSVVNYREDLLLDSMERKSAQFLKKIPFGSQIFGLIWSHLLIADKY